jgi:hypothetical protein
MIIFQTIRINNLTNKKIPFSLNEKGIFTRFSLIYSTITFLAEAAS